MLPLSDPGPRLLPSTLALHRATHLLSSRNLQAEPLPHPLPPSLHPPAPVDLAEFDIDFILSGSSAQLGSTLGASLGYEDKDKFRNLPTDVVRSKPGGQPNVPRTPTLNLAGGEGEDTFAKFVGAHDDEYGGRRGEWTFRACPSPSPARESAQSHESSQLQRSGSAQSASLSGHDPLDTTAGILPRAEWDCHGAGKYELYVNGEIKSVQTGTMWKVLKTGSRAYELFNTPINRLKTGANLVAATHDTEGGLSLTTKTAHCEAGGIKMAPPLADSYMVADAHESSLNTIKEYGSSDWTKRMDSSDSVTPKTSLISNSLPLGIFGSPGKRSQWHHHTTDKGTGEGDVPAPSSGLSSLGIMRESRSRNDERRISDSTPGVLADREKEQSQSTIAKSLGGKIRRAIRATVTGQSHAAQEDRKAQREGKDREKAQSQSWSPGQSHRGTSPTHHHRSIQDQQGHIYTQSTGGRIDSAQEQSSTFSTYSMSGSDTPSSKPLPQSLSRDKDTIEPNTAASASPRITPAADLTWLPGEGWTCVPDEAVAMVIPMQDATVLPTRASKQALLVWYVPFNSDDDTRPTTATSSVSSHSFRRVSDHDGHPTHTSQRATSPRPPWSDRDRDSHKDRDGKSDTSHGSGSLPKFQKLLKRRTSREKEALRREKERDREEREREKERDREKYDPSVHSSSWTAISGSHEDSSASASASSHGQHGITTTISGTSASGTGSGTGTGTGTATGTTSGSGGGSGYGPNSRHPADNLYPLPFRSFRVVARIVDLDDLCSKPPAVKDEHLLGVGVGTGGLSHTVSNHSPLNPHLELHSSSSAKKISHLIVAQDPAASVPALVHSLETTATTTTMSSVPSPTALALAGRQFPTVLAVCHSRSSGVEFVLEGLDRLGLCKGDSAWGPTGYEEWRGNGLSEKGREVLDLLWAGCTGVMGLLGQ